MSVMPEKDHDAGPVDEKMVNTRLDEAPNVNDHAPPHMFTAEEEKQLWRKVDLRLMPILTVMYLLSFMDRGNIGNAKLDGLLTQLNLTGNRYNIALTMFFIVGTLSFSFRLQFDWFLVITELMAPLSLALKAFRPSRWLPSIMVVWGIVMTLMGLVKTYPELVAVRFCLGVAEAGLFPGISYYLTLWFPRHMLQYRIGLFLGAATVAGAFSGLLAFAIGFMKGVGHLEGWSWIFILEGLLTTVVAFIAFFVIVDYPSTATFLTLEERAYLVWRKKYDNSSVGEEEHFSPRHILAAFTDWQVYLQTLVSMSIGAPLYGITLFLPTIINSFGYTTTISQLLTIPPYVVATIVLLTCSHFSDKLKIRSPFILANLLLLFIGYCINLSDVPNSVKYFGTFLIVTGSFTAITGVIAWLGNNLAGQYKRAVGMAFQVGIGNFGGVIASNIYRSRDSPRFILGHGLELMFASIGLVVVPILVISYWRINQARDEAERRRIERGEKLELTTQELRDLGDRAPDFRYTL